VNLQNLADFLGLQKVKIRGDELHASCPFPEKHLSGKDEHPSFSINVEKGVYGCFSCSSRGLIEELVAKIKGVSISEALSLLEEAGFSRIDLLLREKPKEERPEFLPEGILEFFEKVEDDFAEIYKGEIDDIDCWIYVVRDTQGRLVGGQARSVEGRFHKKLYNTPYKLYFYGEERIKNGFPICITEGPADCISLRKSGLFNSLAIMGMHLSDEQAQKLLNFSSEFVVCLDADTAGATGMRRIHDVLDNRALVRYVDPFKSFLKGEKDIRDVYQQRGPEVVRAIIESAKTYLEWVLEDNLK
jgi:DNA primase